MTNMNHLILLCALCLPASISFKTSASEDAKNRELNVLTNVKSQLQRIHWHTLHDDKNWIFTVETKLDNGNTGEKIQQTKQRFVPDMPPAQQWQLLESDFAMPTHPQDLHSSKKHSCKWRNPANVRTLVI